MFHVQYISGNNVIDDESDASKVRIWHQSGDHILTLTPDGFGSWDVNYVTESFGQGADWWIGNQFNSIEQAITVITHFAKECDYDVY